MRLELEFNEKPDTNFPALPMATVLIRDCDRDFDGIPLLTRRCDNFASLDAEITRIIKMLEAIRIQARSSS